MKPLFAAVFICMIACSKSDIPKSDSPVDQSEYIRFTILKGKHYSTKSEVLPVTLSALTFKVRFDSSAIYQTYDPENQMDVNKLIGFTEGANPHLNSARIGWSYNESALRLYAYTYVNGERFSDEIGAVALNEDHECSISLNGDRYVFAVNNKKVTHPRFTNTVTAQGYMLYPYFGGTEAAPRDINIEFRQLAVIP